MLYHGLAPTLGVLALTFSTVACLIVVGLRSFSPFFVALTLFFALGFPVKFFFHWIFGADFIEPIGSFDWSESQWNEVLLASSAALAGLSCAALIEWKVVGNRGIPAADATPAIASSRTFARIEKPIAAVSIIVAITAFLANWYFGFVKIGMDPATFLPRPLHIVLSFIVSWGAALWLACLAYWSWSAGRLSMPWVLALGLVQGVLATVSIASRARYVFHAMAFALAWLWRPSSSPRWHLSIKAFVVLCVMGVFGLGLSLYLVSADRMAMYAEGSTMARLDDRDRQRGGVVISESEMVAQISRLFIARWIGAEGVMAVAATPEKGAALFWEGVTESPSVGNDGIFERISDSPYEKKPGLTFLTTAGGVAILYYSGSAVVVFLGVLGLGILGGLTERISYLFTSSPFAASVVSVCAANFVCQVNQPYTPFVFMLMMLAACALAFLFRLAVVRLDK